MRSIARELIAGDFGPESATARGSISSAGALQLRGQSTVLSGSNREELSVGEQGSETTASETKGGLGRLGECLNESFPAGSPETLGEDIVRLLLDLSRDTAPPPGTRVVTKGKRQRRPNSSPRR